MNFDSVRERRAEEKAVLGGASTVIIKRWSSSIWKLLWKSLLVYVLAYLSISCIYRYCLPIEGKKSFENLARFCNRKIAGLPLTFLLGFYVTMVVNRWWSQYCSLPWPDNLAMFLAAVKVKEGDEEKARITRRTIIRYLVLSYVLALRRLSPLLRNKFPTMESLVKTGLVTQEEAARIGPEYSIKEHGTSNWWLPLQWITQLAHQDDDLFSSSVYTLFNVQLFQYRSSLTKVLTYGHVPIPLVYSQVVHLAVYIYFATSLIGEQWLLCRENCDQHIDLYFPIFMTFKFLFYMGWLKVAEALYNPFGEDDDDFNLQVLIHRHLKVGFSIVDKTVDPPIPVKDVFFDQKDPVLVAHLNFGFGEGAEPDQNMKNIEI